MFSKGASIVGPITTIGPIWLVYYLAASEVPKPIEVTVRDSEEKVVEETVQEEEDSKQEQQQEELEEKKEDEKKVGDSISITESVLKWTDNILSFFKTVTKFNKN